MTDRKYGELNDPVPCGFGVDGLEVFPVSDPAKLGAIPVKLAPSVRFSARKSEILDMLKNSQLKKPTCGAG